jgi:signal transduction histidine kinase
MSVQGRKIKRNRFRKGIFRASTIRIVLPAVTTFLLFLVTIYFIFIPILESLQMKNEREMIRELTRTVISDLNSFEERARSGESTMQEAQAAAIEHVRKLRYGPELKDYFWIHSLDARMVVHPYREDLNEQDVSDFADPTGKKLFAEMVEVVKKAGHGYVDYMWQWKDDPERVVPKTSYVQLFEPWGWVVGTGVYLEDVRNEINAATFFFTLISTAVLAVVAILTFTLARTGMRAEDKRLTAEINLKTAAINLSRQKMQLQKLVGELEHSNKELDDFAYVVSHDLKEPLRGILGFSKILVRDYGGQIDEEWLSSLEAIQRLSLRMQTLIDTLLHYSRVGKKELKLEETDLSRLLEEVLDSIKLTLEESGAKIKIADWMPTVSCDRVLMGELFANLIINAIKYSDKPEKIVEIGWNEVVSDEGLGGSDNVYFVRDNGIGIAQKDFERIFTIFRRLHPQSEFGGGVGAGLTIVRKIIDKHGGRLWLESEPGEGSTFYFTVGEA